MVSILDVLGRYGTLKNGGSLGIVKTCEIVGFRSRIQANANSPLIHFLNIQKKIDSNKEIIMLVDIGK